MAFGMTPLGNDITPPPEPFIEKTGVRLLRLPEMLPEVDYLVLCCNLTVDNHHMVNRETLALMKPGSYIVNVARGALIDEMALVGALERGAIAGAALDVFESEPIARDHPLHSLDNCIFGAHNGSNTIEGVLRANEKAIANLLSVL